MFLAFFAVKSLMSFRRYKQEIFKRKGRLERRQARGEISLIKSGTDRYWPND